MEYYFEDIKKNLLQAIDEAEFIIYCAVAWITDYDIIEALITKSKNGVKIELLVNDDDTFLAKQTYFKPFVDAGGKLYLYPRGGGLMHNKFCVIDLNTVITGSYNWTYSASTLHEENIIIIRDSIASRDFSRQFRKLKQSSIIFQNLQQSANNDIGKYVAISDILWNMPSEYSEEVKEVIREKSGEDGLKKLDYWYGQVFVTDGNKEGIFIIECENQIATPSKIFGYWNGLMTTDINEKFYDFICLDPSLIKYT